MTSLWLRKGKVIAIGKTPSGPYAVVGFVSDSDDFSCEFPLPLINIDDARIGQHATLSVTLEEE